MRSLLFSCLILVASPAFAASEGDWFASLYTGEGTELRADERVFALFAVLNALGFDQGPVSRKEPVPKVNYHPVRQQVRARVIGGDPEVRRVADDFLDKHPATLRNYLTWAVQGSPPPFASAPKSKEKEIADLKGFEAVLSKAWTGWKLGELMGTVQADYRKALKAYLTAIDGPLLKARNILKVPDNAPQSLLVVNLLDAQDVVRGVMGDGEIVLVVGPSEKPNVEGLLREYARVLIDPVVAKKASGWAGGVQLMKEAQVAGATEQTVGDYATGLLTYAVALRAMDANDAAWEAAQNKGYYGIKDIAKMFDDGRPLDVWVLDALAKAETRRPAKK
jgi:hypothetical protein